MNSVLAAYSNPIFVIDGHRQIIAINDSAQRLMHRHSAISTVGRGLMFRRDEEQSALIDAIAALRIPEATPVLLMARSRELRPLLLLRLVAMQLEWMGYILCTIEDLAAEIGDTVEFANVMGITKAQARTVSLLIKGLNIPEIAARLGVAEATLRSHVRQAMSRLGLTSQAELAIWAARIAGFAGLTDTMPK